MCETISGAQTMCKDIAVVYRYVQNAMARRLEPMGIGASQYPRLLFACREPGVSQDRMTSGLLFNKSSIARAIASLEQSGFLRRETDPADRRSYRVYPTDRAWEALPVIMRELEGVADELTAGFTPEERDAARSLLTRMAENAAIPPESGKGRDVAQDE